LLSHFLILFFNFFVKPYTDLVRIFVLYLRNITITTEFVASKVEYNDT